MLNQAQQIHKHIEDAEHILITFRGDGGGDAIGSAVALFLFLEQLGKRVDMVVDGFSLPRQLKFLKKAKKIKPAFSHLQKFILTLDVKNTGVKELSYDIKNEKLRISITPKEGFLTRDNVRTAQSDFKYDLVITIDTRDLKSLGDMYINNTELFYRVPIVNIDSHAGNEHFGQMNLVDLTTASTAEVVFGLIQKLGQEYINEDIATALLTGMIARTHSFKTDDIKPSTLALASRLIGLGAKRDYIVQNLYRTRTINSLKLWGQALSHLENDPKMGLVSTTITREDFTRSGATEGDLYEIVDELIGNSPEAKMILIIHEHADDTSIHAILTTQKERDALELLRPFSPSGSPNRASCIIRGKTLKQAEEEIIGHIKKQ
jgi:phosphoesterase RecJ-like protein